MLYCSHLKLIVKSLFIVNEARILNFFMKKLTRDRVVRIVSASVDANR